MGVLFRELKACSLILASCLASHALLAQDSRTVTEPTIPPSCVHLDASLQAFGDKVALADERKLDTDRIQKALDSCTPGMAVELRPSSGNNAFLTGPLELRTGVTLLIDEGVTLYGSRDASLYEIPGDTAPSGQIPEVPPAAPSAKPTHPAHAAKPAAPSTQALCGTISSDAATVFPAPPAGARHGGCRPLISVDNVHNAAIMGDGVIDGRGYATILGKDYSWWQMARKAEPQNLKYYSTRLIVANQADGFILYRITLHNSPNYHVVVSRTNGFTAWGVHLLTPTQKGTDARNTDGIDPGNSSNITISHAWIDNGDDNVAIKTGVSHISVLDSHFYDGHGMSIGSETYSGDSFLLVDGLTEDHTTSGIRIKSNVTRGGEVHDLLYRNICMQDVKNPIAISPYYTNQTTEPFDDPKYTGDKIPDYKRIRLENVIASTPGDVLIAGIDAAHRTELQLNNVVVEGISTGQVHGHFASVEIGPAGTNLDFSGTDITVTRPAAVRNTLPASDFSCKGRFLPMQ